MERDNVLKQLDPWLERHRRFTWRPIISENDGPTRSSKFSGIPWLSQAEEWPLCIGCSEPLQLFLQLNLSALPEELQGRFGEGLLQLFYCVNFDCDTSLYPWQPFAEPTVVRVVHPLGPERTDAKLPPSNFPARAIVGWEIDADFPSIAEHEELGLTYKYDLRKKRVDIAWPEAGVEISNLDFETAHSVASACDGDKLSGWPYWVQGIEYPKCPVCNQRMEFLFQIDSDKNLPFGFGDAGCGHITQCATHKDIVAFSWACC